MSQLARVEACLVSKTMLVSAESPGIARQRALPELAEAIQIVPRGHEATAPWLHRTTRVSAPVIATIPSVAITRIAGKEPFVLVRMSGVGRVFKATAWFGPIVSPGVVIGPVTIRWSIVAWR